MKCKYCLAYAFALLFLNQFCNVIQAQSYRIGMFDKDSLSVGPSVIRSNKKQIYPSVGLMLTGTLANFDKPIPFKTWVAGIRAQHLPNFQTRIDDYIQFLPIASVYTLNALGYPSKNDFLNRSIILLKGELFMESVVLGMKSSLRNLRPDGSAYNAFPSGHTAQAFAAATFLSEEYKSKYKWMPYVPYGLASCVGSFRVLNNRHYISDVLMGAGIGILSMKLAYWTHSYGKRRKQN